MERYNVPVSECRFAHLCAASAGAATLCGLILLLLV